MAAKTTSKEVKEVKEVKKETMKYRLEMSNGDIIEGTLQLREFQPNKDKGFHNSGFQCKISSAPYSQQLSQRRKSWHSICLTFLEIRTGDMCCCDMALPIVTTL